jgi:hypothetical protein
MFRISIVDTPAHRRIVVEGKLSRPWVAELRTSGRNAKRDLEGRGLVIDRSSLTVISLAGEDAIVDLMKEDARFLRRRSCSRRTKATCPEMSTRTRTKSEKSG